MADIVHQLMIHSSPGKVYEAVSNPAGIDKWWSLSCEGTPELAAEYVLNFGPGYNWKARVYRILQDKVFALQFSDADDDWTGTRVCFELESSGDSTRVLFQHNGWQSPNEHYRISCYCWAMYLRLLKRYVEFEEEVPYADRLEV